MDKTVLITGCSSGIGLELIKKFSCNQQWKIICLTRDSNKLQNILSDNMVSTDKIFIYNINLANTESISDTIDKVKQKFNNLDCLINNAGYAYFSTIKDIDLDKTKELFNINLFAIINITKLCLPMLINSQGKIINISSSLGFIGSPLASAYCASKFALEGFTESIYYELKPYGVEVTLVEPGAYRTNFILNSDIFDKPHDTNDINNKHKASFIKFSNKLKQKPPLNNIENLIQKIYKLANSNAKAPIRIRMGKDSKTVYLLKRIIPESIFFRLMNKINQNTFINVNT